MKKFQRNKLIRIRSRAEVGGTLLKFMVYLHEETRLRVDSYIGFWHQLRSPVNMIVLSSFKIGL